MPKNVIIYSTPTCGFCVRAKQFLKENNVVYQEFDVSRDSSKADEMIKKSGQMGVPVLDIEGEIIVGFDKEQIKNTLGI